VTGRKSTASKGESQGEAGAARKGVAPRQGRGRKEEEVERGAKLKPGSSAGREEAGLRKGENE
jgi:hypothetical protein